MRKSARIARQIAKTRAYRRPINRGDRGSSPSLTGDSSGNHQHADLPARFREAVEPPPVARIRPAGCVRYPLAGVEQEERT
ncbi:hypothetical protein DIE06_15905 [Burkholderia sp. Bp8998]|nr:hypothetical protein DIE06_15905 [Burkholderia sp. Bp8998]